jgi:hypothetical protein
MKRNLGRALMVAALGMVAIGNRANADSSYVIDPTQSYVEVGIYGGGSPLSGGNLFSYAQVPGTPGSDTSFLQGTLNADTSGGNISFGGGSSISLTNFPTNLLPDVGGGDASGPDPGGTGGAPAEIGLGVNIGGAVTGVASINGATLDVSGGATPVVGGLFDGTQQSISLLTAGITYWLDASGLGAGILYGSEVVAPPISTAQNGVDSNGNSTYQTGTVIGNTITLPLFADVSETVSGITLDVVFQGQIVATLAPVVPEPSTFVLGSIGLVSVLAYRVRRGARKA